MKDASDAIQPDGSDCDAITVQNNSYQVIYCQGCEINSARTRERSKACVWPTLPVDRVFQLVLL